MSTEDVIELGSSDEEEEPAAKKRKTMPNAMVLIPNERSGITIKQNKTSSSLKSSNVQPKSINSTNNLIIGTKPIIVRNWNKNLNSNVLRQTSNLMPVHVPVIKNLTDNKNFPGSQQKLSINPINYIQNLTNRKQITVKKSISIKNNYPALLIQPPKILNNLPPGLTIKPIHNPGVSGIKVNKTVSQQKPYMAKLSSVELDNEPVESCTGSPQWYIRPEQQIDMKSVTDEEESVTIDDRTEPSMEEQNNKEPEALKFVEITIEDSPVKLLESKQDDLGKEFSITIEDSPVKPYLKNNIDNNNEIEMCTEKMPQSKKKLEYPKENNQEKQVVEIEIDIMQTHKCNSNDNFKEASEYNSPSTNELETNSEAKNSGSSDVKNTDIDKDKTMEHEFHPVYQKFIDLCFELENSSDMTKIVEKKIKAYYKQCPKEYVESEEFIEMVSSKISSMKTSPEKMYLFIKDIVDELNLQRKMCKPVVSNKEDKELSSNVQDLEENQYDYKRHRQIRKLEKTIKKLHRAVQKLEEQEVDFDDDDDSVYLLTERYKERLIRVYEKLCQITNTKMPSEPRIHIEARPGRPQGPARKLEMLINKKVPIGTPLPFPDFHDVLKCVREANSEDRLGWSEADIMEEARDLFTRCGKKLQRRRQENEWRIAFSRVGHHMDPAENNIDLKKKFEENQKIAAMKETELLNKFVERQNQMKLEPVEIGDKEAEESPVESDEEEDIKEENSSLDSKERRKDALKRLIEEKNKKNDVKKDNSESLELKNVDDTAMADFKENEKNVPTTQKESEINTEISPEDKQDDINKEEEEVVGNKNNIETEELEDSDNVTVTSALDELNLLSKLYSENELDSSQDCSDSDASVITLDSIEMNSDNENSPRILNDDVISIENSSYSESECTMDGLRDNKFCVSPIIEDVITEDKHREEIVENILLASSDEENSNAAAEGFNLKDNGVAMSETITDSHGNVRHNALVNNDGEGSDVVSFLNDEEVHDTEDADAVIADANLLEEEDECEQNNFQNQSASEASVGVE